PDILVVDTHPGGSMNELQPILRWALRRVFIYREQNENYAGDATFQSQVGRYHRVLVPHDRNTGGLHMPPTQAPPDFVGHMLLRSSTEGLNREEARDRLALPRDRTIVCVSFGGGGDPAYAGVQEWVLEQAAAFPRLHF